MTTSCCVVAICSTEEAGDSAIDTKVAAATVTPVLAVLPPKVAVIDEVPADTPVTRPVLAPIVATAGAAEA
jgi:hypothetical protein